MNRVKLLAATLLVAGGLGAGVGGGWLARVGAQDKRPPSAGKPLVQEVIDRLTTMNGIPAPKWEYDIAQPEDLDAAKFTALLHKRTADGWEFTGQVTLFEGGQHLPKWVFRRPAKPPVADTATTESVLIAAERLLVGREKLHTDGSLGIVIDQTLDTDDPVARLRRIEMLEAELARLKATTPASAVQKDAQFPRDMLPLPPAELSQLLSRLARRRFGDDKLVIGVGDKDGGTLAIRGDKARVEWAEAVIRAMTAAPSPAK